jgi:DNA polymerase IV
MILHVDMDAFYASVEQRDNPSLVGKPVVVGGSASGRGVVAAASYEARQFGIHSALSAYRAVQLCPHAVFIKPRIDYYASVSKQIHAIFEQFTPLIEPISLDEAFLDVTGSERLLGPAASIGAEIQRRIRSELQLAASVGVAPNKFLAKIASDLKKPNGFVVVEPHEVQDFLDPLPIGRIWGIGKVTAETFRKHSIGTIRQLRQLPLEVVTSWFGSSGEHYWNLAHGIDERSVVPDREAKSISNETTFAEDISDKEVLRAWLVLLVEQVARRLRRHDRLGKTVELKVRYADFRTVTRSKSLSNPTNITDELLEAGIELLSEKLPSNPLPIRLLGFGVSGLDTTGWVQPGLFDEQEKQKSRELDSISDVIASKFGKDALHRATGLRPASEQAKRKTDPNRQNKDRDSR